MRRLLCLLFSLVLVAQVAWAKPTPMSLTVDHGIPLTLSAPATSVFVANPDIADVQLLSPTSVMLFGKRTGTTSFMATGDNGTPLAERTLIVTQDLSDLRQELRDAIPGNEIKAKPVPGGIILTGTARDAASVADAYKIAMRYMPEGGDIINRVQVTGSNQIQIRVRFAEVQRNVDNSLGFNWQNLWSGGSNFALGIATGNDVVSGTSFLRPNNTSLSMANDAISTHAKLGNLTVDGMIDALAQEGYLTILAEPNLTAMSGETANFLAGGEFPIPIPQGNGTISVTYRSYGISLAFTPTLLSGNRISLHVRPEVSELTTVGSITMDNIAVPALTSRKAETTVEVASGQSFAIAGLMNNSQAQTINKFPGLGDLPVLGALFRSDHFVNGQTELVVIITPYIVKPSASRMALPTDGYAPPSESERLLDRRYSSADPNAKPVSGGPTAVMASPEAAPVVPVASSSTAPVKPLFAPVAESPAPAVAMPTPVPVAQPVPETKPAAPLAPLVLHTRNDANKRVGGLLVE